MSAEIRAARVDGSETPTVECEEDILEGERITALKGGTRGCEVKRDFGTVSNCLVNHFRGVAIPRPENGPH